jgi:hypothetical protein
MVQLLRLLLTLYHEHGLSKLQSNPCIEGQVDNLVDKVVVVNWPPSGTAIKGIGLQKEEYVRRISSTPKINF